MYRETMAAECVAEARASVQVSTKSDDGSEHLWAGLSEISLAADMFSWCRTHPNVVVLADGMILTSTPEDRVVHNCKTVMRNRGMQPSSVVPASHELIQLLRINYSLDSEPNDFSIQLHRKRVLDGLIKNALSKRLEQIDVAVSEQEATVRYAKYGNFSLTEKWWGKLAHEAMNCLWFGDVSSLNLALKKQAASKECYYRMEDGSQVAMRLAFMVTEVGYEVQISLVDKTLLNATLSFKALGAASEQQALVKHALMAPQSLVISGAAEVLHAQHMVENCQRLLADKKRLYSAEGARRQSDTPSLHVSRRSVHEKLNLDTRFLAKDSLYLPEMDIRYDERLATQVIQRGGSLLASFSASSALQLVKQLRTFLLNAHQLLLTAPVTIIFNQSYPTLCTYCAHSFASASRPHQDLERWQTYFGKAGCKQLKVRGNGCGQCNNSGYGDDIVCTEVISIDTEGWRCLQEESWSEWERYLQQHGYQSCDEQVISLIKKGKCDPGDIENCIGELLLALQQDSVNYYSLCSESSQ